MGRLRNLTNRVFSDPVFWILAVLGAMVGFISFFERFTQVGLNSTYNLF